MRARLAALLLLGLTACGIYGPPERATPPSPEGQPAADPSAAAGAEDCEDGEQPQ
jgi:hypothetical protein